jgi:hypothetical protein
MAIASAVKYTVRFHVDGNPSDAGFNKNIIFDGIDVDAWNDSTYVGGAAVSVIKVGNDPGTNLDTFAVQTSYPAAYASTDPKSLTVAQHIQAAFALVQTVINATPYVGFPGGGPKPVILSLGAITGGTGYPNGTFDQVKLTGGSGYGATADVTVASGIVTVVTLDNPGVEYVVGDVLGISLGVNGASYPAVPGTGFSIPVATAGSDLTNTLY